jgi:hypothetical protein
MDDRRRPPKFRWAIPDEKQQRVRGRAQSSQALAAWPSLGAGAAEHRTEGGYSAHFDACHDRGGRLHV